MEGRQKSTQSTQSDKTSMLLLDTDEKRVFISYFDSLSISDVSLYFNLLNLAHTYPESWHKKRFLKYSETVWIDFILIMHFMFASICIYRDSFLSFLRIRHNKPDDRCNSLLILKHLDGV